MPEDGTVRAMRTLRPATPGVIRTGDYRFQKREVTRPVERMPRARGTVEDVRPTAPVAEPSAAWFWAYWCETFTRNLAIAAALRTELRRGRAQGRFESARHKVFMP